MVSQPFPHPLGAQVPVQRRPKGLGQSLNLVGEVEVPVISTGGGGVEDQISIRVVGINILKESAVVDAVWTQCEAKNRRGKSED
ncbi:hypothetical protein TorRG33x02_280190 [Trema orientale]|uniref:Uncharacterized protein n=1 Tax=Trema orientale TaxID=63057 RepID=A0A2P5CMA0_TREOI|nr:hypothetical protein TorRG33x02_280190 [Trema orientale]